MGETAVRARSGAVLVVVLVAAMGLGPWTNALLWWGLGWAALREWRKVEGTYRPDGISQARDLGMGLVIAAVMGSMVAVGGWGEAYDRWRVMGLVFMIWANDTGAYLVGKPWGKHKIWPAISPGKSWEGLVGGLLAAAGVAAWMWGAEHAGVGVVTGLLATAGDFTESAWKRARGIKDSGQFLPGHGGVLDRFDGWLYAAPAYAVYWWLVGG